MEQIEKMLFTPYLGIPLVLWLGILTLAAVVVFRCRRIHFRYRSRDRRIEIDTDEAR